MKRTMSSVVLGGLMVFLFATTAHVATYDFTGEWSYTTSLHENDEGCPVVDETSGLMTITQDGETFTLTIDTGMECTPAWICEFEGFISADDWYIGSTSGDLEAAGATGIGNIDFQADSSTSADGQVTFTYTFEDTTSCEWIYDFELAPAEAPIDDTDDSSTDEPPEGPDAELDQACDCITVGRTNASVVLDLLSFLLSTW